MDLSFTPKMQLNMTSIDKSRVVSNIFIGMTAGIFGLGAFQGVIWWIAMSILTSVLIALRVSSMGFESNGSSKYFESLAQAATTNMFSNIMTYMLFWVMFYNIVYVV